jgi:hypothetical protein
MDVVNSISIRLDHHGTFCTLKEEIGTPFKVGSVLLSPLDSLSGAYEVTTHKLAYDGRMKSTRIASEHYARFSSALRMVLQVSKTDLNQMLADEKRANAGKPKRGPKPKRSSASVRASHAKD